MTDNPIPLNADELAALRSGVMSWGGLAARIFATIDFLKTEADTAYARGKADGQRGNPFTGMAGDGQGLL